MEQTGCLRNTEYALRFLFFLFTLSLYTFTLSPSLLPADAGEYQVVGALLGVAHPPGFALYTLLSWLTTRVLFFIQPAAAINFLSALLASLTLVLLSRAVQRLTGSRLAGISAALALGFSTTFWAQAVTANVRMPTAFAAALALDHITNYQLRSRSPAHLGFGSWDLGFIALALGLGVSHHGSLIFAAAVLGLYALWLNPAVLRRPWPLFLGLIPFLAWLYFPLRAGAFGAPPRLATLDGFLEHILARGFSGDLFFFATSEFLPDRMRIFGNILAFQWTWPVLVLSALGGLAALYRDRRSGALLLAAFVVHSFVSITYHSPQTVEYLLPSYVFMAALMGYAFAELFRAILFFTAKAAKFAERFAFISPFSRPHLGFGIWDLGFSLPLSLTLLLPQVLSTFPSYLALARDASTREYVSALLAAAPREAVILSSWHWATPLWYAQKVEGWRPDVEVRYVYPRTDSLADDWVKEIETTLPARPVVVTSYYPQEFNALPYRFIPFASAWQVLDRPLTPPPGGLTGYQAFAEWEFLGYHLYSTHSSVRSVDLTAAWRTTAAPRDINFFVHLVGPDGQLYGQMDVSHPAARYVVGEVLLDRYQIAIRPDTPPGDYALVAGAYLPDGARLAETRLTRLSIAPRPTAPVTLHPFSRNFSGANLVGYDVDHTLPDSPRLYLHWQLGPQPVTLSILDASFTLPAGPGYLTTTHDLLPGQPASISNLQLPTSNLRLPISTRSIQSPTPLRFASGANVSNPQSRYVPFGNALFLTEARLSTSSLRPGQTLTVDLRFLAARPLTADYTVSVSIAGAGWRVQSDVTPAGGAIPTLKWITGSRIADRHALTIPANAAPGPAQVFLAIYDAFTQRNLALLDPRLALLGPAAPLGTVEIAAP